jgi:hypothetical protein
LSRLDLNLDRRRAFLLSRADYALDVGLGDAGRAVGHVYTRYWKVERVNAMVNIKNYFLSAAVLLSARGRHQQPKNTLFLPRHKRAVNI